MILEEEEGKKKRTISRSSYSAGTDFLDLILSYINGWVNAGSSNSLWPLWVFGKFSMI